MSEGAVTITEEIEELRKKMALLDGDRKAYFESSQWTMKKNKETIAKLREKNKQLRADLAKKKAGDEKVIDEAFKERDPQRHCAMRGMSGKAAIIKLDQQVCEAVKRLNALRHQKNSHEKKLQALQTEYNQLVTEAEEVSNTDAGESAEAQKLRSLENSLDKMTLKCNEAKKIKTIYEGLLEQLKEERRTWPNQLNNLERAICAQREELGELNAMNHDAQIAREAAKAELTKLEQSVYERKKERERELSQYKKQAEEKKDHAEKVEKRLQRSSLQQEDLSVEQKAVLSGEEQERKITTYEEAMNKIKDTTGVSDIKEVVQRFLSQGETQKHLEQLKTNNEKMLARLKEEKDKLRMEYEEMKYSGEAKLSSGQRMLEEFQQRLAQEEKRNAEAKDRQERANKILVNVKAGIEHLADKLQHLKAPKGHVPQAQLSPTSDEYILDLLGTSEQKLLKLMDELGGKDINDVMKEMEDAEFRTTMEGKLPQHNTRIKLPMTSDRLAVYDDDEESGEDEDVLSRNAIKRYSQQIVDSKTKKKTRKGKKKTKQ
ncbi:outer dynein arm-docking complex subunit 3-like [Porites lutea]|uniref:outer dynein arm-docking complex subunit 3-like n=1 Tax=Porites lutea TaxID=51062 RepID=UPI003CC69212